MVSSRIYKSLGVAAIAAMLLSGTIAFADNGSGNSGNSGNSGSSGDSGHSMSVSTKIRAQNFSGTVTNVSGTMLTISAKNGTSYTVDMSNAKLLRRFGASMGAGDFQNGDMVMVRGTLSGTTIMGTIIHDMSLQAKNGTFSGTIASVGSGSFSLSSKERGSQTINFDSATVFKKNDKAATSADLLAGETVRVSGVWDRTNSNVTAKTVTIIIRMMHVTLKGTLSAISGTTLTVTGKDGGAITVDASKARFVRKFNGKSSVAELNVNDSVQVMGTSVAGSTNVTASLVKDNSITSKTVSAGANASANTNVQLNH